jgi:hypothetical protein
MRSGEGARLVREMIARNHKPPYEMKHSANIHDEETARRQGFEGALVTGAVVGAYAIPTLFERWGDAWLERGQFALKFKRPVYDGQTVDMIFDFGRDEDRETAILEIRHGDSVVIDGSAALPDSLPAIALDRFDGPALPIPESPPPAVPGLLKVGQRLGSEPLTVDAEGLALFTERLDLTPGQWPADRVHPFIYMNITSIHQVSSLAFPTPGIHASMDMQILSAARVGETLETVGFISEVYEHKGHHYFAAEQLVRTTDGRAIAVSKNRVVYRTRNAEEN